MLVTRTNSTVQAPSHHPHDVRIDIGRTGGSPGDAPAARPGAISPWCGATIVAAAAVWSYWSILVSLWSDLQHDDYSVGLLVPPAAGFLLYRERGMLRHTRPRPCWWGLGVILAAELGRAFGLVFLYESAERYAFVLTITGLVLLLAGKLIFWRLKWLLAFLFLMVPLPGQVHNLISGPLQSWATVGAGFMLELLGVSVIREGHLLTLDNETPLAVAEACSGLRMLTAFVVISALLAYLVRRPGWQKAVLVLTSVPIAILCNLLRLVATAMLFVHAGREVAESFFHDFAGLTMMPAALLFLTLELWIMDRLILRDAPAPAACSMPAAGVPLPALEPGSDALPSVGRDS